MQMTRKLVGLGLLLEGNRIVGLGLLLERE